LQAKSSWATRLDPILRPIDTHAPGLRGFAEALGRGTHLLVVLSEPADEKDYETLCATGEAFVHAAMTRLIE
jgi:hypothetical protein